MPSLLNKTASSVSSASSLSSSSSDDETSLAKKCNDIKKERPKKVNSKVLANNADVEEKILHEENKQFSAGEEKNSNDSRRLDVGVEQKIMHEVKKEVSDGEKNGEKNDLHENSPLNTQSTSSDEEENKEEETASVNLHPKKVSVKRKRLSSDEKQSDKENIDSRKLSNLKRYLNACGVRISNYKKLFETCRSMKSREKKLAGMIGDLGVIGRPTLPKCRKIRLKREEEKELADLDQRSIISGINQRTSRSSSLYATKQSLKTQSSIKKRYEFGSISVDSDGSISSNENEIPKSKKRKVLPPSSEDEGAVA